ncbi:hypothetical protein TELCIR_20983 [Teladorsagia circumcincta]|uniref:Aminotransferase class I/classII domain-containing protein n=1 Tax=Teladorsagia circumcincta TaxID=45464 RepID=A0A2G9TI73_TELCI|nr:hypothetical protein TELCIR_20983 [Teladorsagia circumcincta]
MSKLPGAICIDDFMHRQLEDRTNILECAWQERHDNLNESDESEAEAELIPERSDSILEDTQEGRDIYGKVTERAPNEFEHASGPCADAAVAQIDKEGLATCTTVHERGDLATDEAHLNAVCQKTPFRTTDIFASGSASMPRQASLFSERKLPGRSTSQYELEKLVAEFLHVEDAIVFSMGFATNSMNAPCLVDKVQRVIPLIALLSVTMPSF